MAHVTIPDVAPRVSYTVTSSDSSFAVPFTFFEDADLKVYQGGDLLTLTTDYTVTGTAGTEGGYVGGTVDLVVAAEDTTIVIIRDQAVERTSDHPNSGPFNIQTLNTTFDKLVGMLQRFADRIGRAIRIPDSDATGTSLELPVAATRAGKFLKFDATGNVDVEGNALAGLMALSTTSLDLTAGSKTATLDDEIDFRAGMFVLLIDRDNPTTKQMTGQVTSRSGADITFTVAASDILGSGSGLSNWLVVVSGARGATGATGASGSDGADGASAPLAVDPVIRTGNFNAVSGYIYMVNTASVAIVATLDASPGQGAEVEFIDATGNFSVNNLTAARNGNTIDGTAADFVLNISRVGHRLSFNDTANDWRVL